MVMLLRTCPCCGGSVEWANGPVEWDVRGRMAVVEDVGHGICQKCGETFFADGIVDAVHKRAVEMIKREMGLLMGSEIRAIRRELGLSQEAFERAIGAGQKTVVRWENDSVFQNRTADTLLRILRDYPQVAHDLIGRSTCA